ncbi:glycosyltransferase [Luteimonas dalianensis]|uniref:glycosyltransferase n=1 Tax=Luteimonas dalianensis TaxID=1148196 RepID=UPI003BF1A02F
MISVWRRPRSVGGIFSAVRGAHRIRELIRRYEIDVVLSRSTMPALATLLARIPASTHVVYDADGLPLDERVEFAGQNASGVVLRLLRDVEAEIVRRACRVLVRSRSAISVLVSRAGAGTSDGKFHVVGNGRDPGEFFPSNDGRRSRIRAEIGLAPETPLLVYVGSMGPKYLLPEMLKLFRFVRSKRSDAHLLILTNDPSRVLPLVESESSIADGTHVMSVAPSEVPSLLECGDLGLALILQSYSMTAVAPIKWGEYLLSGVPVVTTSGIGDTVLISGDCGMVVDMVDDESLQSVADWFVQVVLGDREGFRQRCRALGIERFSLESSIERYRVALGGLHAGR